jgi:hypothetical protein
LICQLDLEIVYRFLWPIASYLALPSIECAGMYIAISVDIAVTIAFAKNCGDAVKMLLTTLQFAMADVL